MVSTHFPCSDRGQSRYRVVGLRLLDLQQTNKSLIETLDELNKIQSEGRAKRVAAEQELTRIEDELKTKMMEIRS